ncbi:hypothetical protein [Nocardiopsis baichengensis]|uniref:hypothetical protein n=1 Tax=Nocardiopsis baichengensis TaxID=280240 RepID=UPI0003487DFA|nr:hypothetical protein [Nocardiopsis baichengensis]
MNEPLLDEAFTEAAQRAERAGLRLTRLPVPTGNEYRLFRGGRCIRRYRFLSGVQAYLRSPRR